MIGTRSRVSLCALGVVIPLLLAQSAAAATVQCGDVSCLVTAIHQANARPHRPMTIHLVGGTYTLLEGLPLITSTVTIDVPPGTVITRDASKLPEFRLLQVAATGNLTITGLTLQGGVPGIVNAGTLFVTDSTFLGGFVGAGSGAVSNTGTLTLFRTAVVDSGGFVTSAVVSSGGLVTISQSLFSGHNGLLPDSALAIKGGEAHISRTTFTKGNQDGPSSLSVLRLPMSPCMIAPLSIILGA